MNLGGGWVGESLVERMRGMQKVPDSIPSTSYLKGSHLEEDVRVPILMGP